jgi:hypothetical protein
MWSAIVCNTRRCGGISHLYDGLVWADVSCRCGKSNVVRNKLERLQENGSAGLTRLFANDLGSKQTPGAEFSMYPQSIRPSCQKLIESQLQVQSLHISKLVIQILIRRRCNSQAWLTFDPPFDVNTMYNKIFDRGLDIKLEYKA